MPDILLGSYLMRRLDPEIIRRICMSFDAGVGLSLVMIELDLVQRAWAYNVRGGDTDGSRYTCSLPPTVQFGRSEANCGYQRLNDAGWHLGIECARVVDLSDADLFPAWPPETRNNRISKVRGRH
ncbi:hypothetical protein [Bradyrhizobium sp. ERR14]|uniref:hypothetical protein n=1 Tax=Bradyrhizobium sp. ERR14 TaxID=2663837 RepID=UPI001619419F|nr:hypothetical protein [Bradyrhizobium sp. ERR14]MBB4398558.1 hypothetical protein [Bradyrhizobium sp. ERR14]